MSEHNDKIREYAVKIAKYLDEKKALIEKQKAEKLMCLAKVKRVASKIPSEKIKESISNYIEEAFNE